MKLLITGAGGFVGAAVAKAAVARGHDVVALARAERPWRLGGMADQVGHHRIDMADADGIARVLADERPDAVVHTAWSGIVAAERNAAAQVSDNVGTTCRLVELAGQAGVAKFVGIGSQAEYGRLDRPIDEEDRPEPTTLYGAAKQASYLLGRVLAAQAGMAFAWLRLFAAYGPGDNGSWLIPSLVAALREGVAPKLTPGTQKWDYLYIDDAAAAIVDVCEADGANDAFNLASGQPIAVRTIAEKLRDRLAPGLPLAFGEVPFGAGQIMHLEGRIERLSAATGWRPRIGFDEGLDRLVAAA